MCAKCLFSICITHFNDLKLHNKIHFYTFQTGPQRKHVLKTITAKYYEQTAEYLKIKETENCTCA